MKNIKSGLLRIIQNILLLAIAVLFLLLEHPNKIYINGFSFLAWFSYIPILFLIHNTKLSKAWIYGLVYGFCYGFFFYHWLKNYDQYGIIAITVYSMIVNAVFFEILKVIDWLFKTYGWLVQWLFICSFEYLLTKGFVGLSFGVTAYSQWNHPAIIQICKIFGVFGLNLLIIFSSCCLYAIAIKFYLRKKIIYNRENDNNFYDCSTHVNFVSEYDKQLKEVAINHCFIAGGIWLVLLISTCVFGVITKKEVTSERTIKIAAIQNNSIPGERNVSTYSKNIQKLMTISDSVLELNSDVDIVVWPETAVVPAIVYHYNARKDENRYKIVSSLLNYIERHNAMFVIGNGHITENENSLEKEKYNSVLVFEPGKNVVPPRPEVYAKNHLVPFSEYFPYEKMFPKFSDLVKKLEPDMWDAGNEIKIFNCKDFVFATPICFEDNFSDLGRKMCLEGARAFINLSDDSWSKSEVCQYQHMAMAVFRSVENGIPTVRSTASGQTCIISPKGKIEKMADSFSETYIVGNVPVINQNQKKNLYTITGDYCGHVPCLAFLFLLIIQIILVIIRKNKNNSSRK